jgi:hypothetical protein
MKTKETLEQIEERLAPDLRVALANTDPANMVEMHSTKWLADINHMLPLSAADPNRCMMVVAAKLTRKVGHKHGHFLPFPKGGVRNAFPRSVRLNVPGKVWLVANVMWAVNGNGPRNPRSVSADDLALTDGHRAYPIPQDNQMFWAELLHAATRLHQEN